MGRAGVAKARRGFQEKVVEGKQGCGRVHGNRQMQCVGCAYPELMSITEAGRGLEDRQSCGNFASSADHGWTRRPAIPISALSVC